MPSISTKQETEAAAIQTALQWLKDGIPREGEVVSLKKYTLRDMAREADITTADCEYVCKELKRRGLLASYVQSQSRAAVFRVQWKEDRTRLANMLTMVTGLRAGKIQGLRVQDLGRDCLYVRHSWNCRDGLKTTKNGESRTVELPFSGLLHELIDLTARNPHGVSMDSYVFWAERLPDKPIEACILLQDLRAALLQTGMSEESAAENSFPYTPTAEAFEWTPIPLK